MTQAGTEMVEGQIHLRVAVAKEVRVEIADSEIQVKEGDKLGNKVFHELKK